MMKNAFYSSFSSQLCNFGNNDVQILNSDVSHDVGGVYGRNFFRDSQVTNDQHLGRFAPLSTVEIPPLSLNYLHLPVLLSASSTSTTSDTIHNNFSQTRLPQIGVSNERKRTRSEDGLSMRSKEYSTIEESKKKKAAISVEDRSPPNYQHFLEKLRRPFGTKAQRVPMRRSEKIGDKITVLQKLISPFGKTDTSSVLKETASYIKQLHQQIQMLSNPYFRAPDPHLLQPHPQGGERKDDLQSKGLCLVSVSFTHNITKERKEG